MNDQRITARELRIGNYVQGAISKSICTVELIHNNHFDCRDEYGTFIPNGKYEGTPLTEEWLLKFGGHRTIDQWTDSYRIESRLLIKTKDGFKDYASGVLFKYVHRLQNFFFEHGTELTIKETASC